jgi:hypothetical protein
MRILMERTFTGRKYSAFLLRIQPPVGVRPP